MQEGSGDSKTFTFYGKELDKKATLMLAFAPPEEAGTLLKDLFPLCWKVVTLSPEDSSFTIIDYPAQTAFFVPRRLPADLIAGLPFMPCDTGKQCFLTATQLGNIITPAVPGIPGYLACTNTAPGVADIGIGFLDVKLPIVQPLFLWNQVLTGTQVKARIIPYLEIYATDEFHESQIIKGLWPSKPIWKKNLQTLGRRTSFEVTADSITGDALVNDYRVV